MITTPEEADELLEKFYPYKEEVRFCIDGAVNAVKKAYDAEKVSAFSIRMTLELGKLEDTEAYVVAANVFLATHVAQMQSFLKRKGVDMMESYRKKIEDADLNTTRTS